MENAKLKQGDIVRVEITGAGVGGEGVGRVGEFVTFIPYTVPGDIVEARVTYVKKSFCNAVLTEVKVASRSRTEPVCNRFGRCGGCTWLNMDYSAQLAEKKAQLTNTLKKIAGYAGDIDEIIPSEQYAYRNKLQLPFGVTDGKVSLGFYKENTHKVVNIGKCYLHADWAEKLITIMKNWANGNRLSVYSDEDKKGLLRHVVARYIDHKLQVTLVLNGDKIPFKNQLISALQSAFSDVTLYLNINIQDTNVILGDTLIPISVHRQSVSVLGIETEINPFSFLQVNDGIRDKMYETVLDKIGSVENALVIDAYAGVGILGAILAKRGAKVYNIEIIPEATADGERLAQANGISGNVTNLTGDAAELLPQLLSDAEIEQGKNTLTVLLDPPRKGCDQKVLDALNRIAEQKEIKLLYISCNPATLSRDLKILSQQFTVGSVTPFDMFPNTPHIETVVCLTKKIAG